MSERRPARGPPQHRGPSCKRRSRVRASALSSDRPIAYVLDCRAVDFRLDASAQFVLANGLLSSAGSARLDSDDPRSPLDHAHRRSPGRSPRDDRPYRFLSHPNYFVVAGEIAALPLCLGLPWFALIFSALNAIVLESAAGPRRVPDTTICLFQRWLISARPSGGRSAKGPGDPGDPRAAAAIQAF
jgi:Isoprenylcysteine carboxyl methyltransferase (ICMT) family